MTSLSITRLCGKCNGSGVETVLVDGVPTEIPCTSCAGKGRILCPNSIDITDLQADMTKCLHRLKKIMDNLGIGD